jgi:uncharacterized membrane protein YgcG
MTNDQRSTNHGAHRHRPPLAPPDLQAKAAMMKAEAEAVTVGDKKWVVAAVVVTKTLPATVMVGAQTQTINNQLKVEVATEAKPLIVTAMAMTTTMMATVVVTTVGGSGSGTCKSQKWGGRGKGRVKRLSGGGGGGVCGGGSGGGVDGSGGGVDSGGGRPGSC